ncbi:MAG: tRNA uridine-5-carboxymethylaminomethyl(34) synthesis GTPase MnmE [Candidatus Omnitrophica bacterium]|nr:tRNA uridine-5-carboxymethylaminomethyl(34) synthesis GTPase MnmE [Candidatus Omnitrophota bacterium]
MPEIHLEDTIAAISTPPGEGGIGVIRLSGPHATSIADCMFRKEKARSAVIASEALRQKTLRVVSEVEPTKQSPGCHSHESGNPEILDPRFRGDDKSLQYAKSHLAQFGYIYDDQNQIIDQVLVTVFRRPKSYTGEDVVEISAHGGSLILRKILDLALSLGARQAEPGEFTRRAFLNGRMDLAQAEAVLDLIRAKTDRSLEIAFRQLTGKLSEELNSIKSELMALYAHIEAYLDFPDEHLEIYSNAEFKSRFQNLLNRIKRLTSSFSKGEILREGACVVLIGRTNVGKSSLLNALLDRDRALVSEIPGTTRDILEESIELEGLWIRLVDTAGLWRSEDPLDQAAMSKTKHYLEEGDLFLWVLDASSGFLEEDKQVLTGLRGKKVVPVVNKMDIQNGKMDLGELERLAGATAVPVSAKTREGLENLEKKIVNLILGTEVAEESVLITRLRHRWALEASLESLEKSFQTFLNMESLEFVVLDLKQSLDALKELVGEIYSEDLLDVIFKEFCIGK